jgi:hypothetical protein
MRRPFAIWCGLEAARAVPRTCRALRFASIKAPGLCFRVAEGGLGVLAHDQIGGNCGGLSPASWA